ncbi:MAG: hypothetical protein HZC54_24670 [Verrucomicrobia bacterium]|nr:hypothetical protein [Verrucomicrobiota bacterium]
MKRIVVCLVSVLLLAVLMPCLFVLYEVCWEVRPGMTRADLLKVFRSEGGVYQRTQRHFVYRRWPPILSWGYIKVVVRFEATEQKTNQSIELPTDKITWISKPYIERGLTID